MLVDSQVLTLPGPLPIDAIPNAADPSAVGGHTAREFRRRVRHLASGVAVVTTADDGQWYGVATNSVCSLSAKTPTLVVCVPRRSHVGRHLGFTRRFGVNVLSRHQRAVGEAFTSPRALHQFRSGGWTAGITGSPVLHGALASFECEVELLYGYPGHVVVTGSVKDVHRTAGTGAPLAPLPGRPVTCEPADALITAAEPGRAG